MAPPPPPHLAAGRKWGGPRRLRCGAAWLLLAALLAAHCGAWAAGEAPAGEDASMTIFASPRPYSGDGDPQLRALRSWLALKNAPQVVLIGRHPTFVDIATAHAPRVSVETEYDSNFLGTPLFHSILHRALAARTRFAVFLTADILLFDDVVDATLRVARRFSGFVATAARWDVTAWPFDEPDGGATHGDAAALLAAVRDHVRRTGMLHSYGGTDVWLWDTQVVNGTQLPLPLHSGLMPPFTYGRGKYDNWLNHAIETTRLRPLVDITTAATTVHVQHGYGHVALHGTPAGASGGELAGGGHGGEESGGGDGDGDGSGEGDGRSVSDTSAETDALLEALKRRSSHAALAGRGLRNFWSSHKRTSWEQFANIVLAQSYGTYANQLGTALHATWKLSACEEPSLGGACLSRRERPAVCSCEYSSAVVRSDKDPVLKDTQWTCGSVSVDSHEVYRVSGMPSGTGKDPVGLPHTLEQLLPKVAVDGTVVLTGVLGNYAHFLFSFACQLRKLGVRNLLVAAFDEEAYRAAFLHGLPVFLFTTPESIAAAHGAEKCHFGTQCFRKVTKVKSRATLRVLELGYNVLFSDTDIVWFEDPLPALRLLAGTTGDLLVQSNEPNASMPANGALRINSGFYYASNNEPTRASFRAIIEHAAASRQSEQPSFYHVLCGKDGVHTVGADECVMPGGVRTRFLNRDIYPNGKHRDLWEAEDVRAATRTVGAKILHNNWAVGAATKMHRQKKFWHYDDRRHVCRYSWLT